jgi:hypothetical protein
MLAKIPVWVFVVLVVLIALGLRQARTRQVPPAVLNATAVALLGLSLAGVGGAFGWHALPLLCWAAGYGLTLAAGPRRLGPHGLAMAGARVTIPGSWLPLALMLGIFAVKFLLGMATGLGLPIVHAAGFIAGVSGVLGLFSGAFGARAWTVHRFVRRHAARAVPAFSGAGMA